MASAQEIIELMHNPSEEDVQLITKAYNLAERAHKDQKRDGGQPYFIHLVETAKNLAGLGMDSSTIAAGLLHDCIEDVGVTPEQIEKEFGKEILFLVQGVTKLRHLHYTGTQRYSESLRKLFVAMAQDLRVLIIRLADRLHNMRTVHETSSEKQKRMATETLEIFAPLAHRLGIRRFSRELEDLSFKYTSPSEFKETEKILKQYSKINLERLEKFVRSLKKALAKEGITDIHTSYRIKGVYSLYKKLIRKNHDMDKVFDIAAVRVIVHSVNDCYRVLGIIHSVWRPLPGRIKDYIAFPKADGYQSLHTTILSGDGGIIEVQIKTQEMYENAEFGSHISYKGSGKNPNENYLWIKRLLPPQYSNNLREDITTTILNDSTHTFEPPQWIKELVEFQARAADDKEFIRNLKADFFEERILVFTPKGDVVNLPVGSCPIDFAYAIHSDIGNHIHSAKVNGKFATLNTTLHNGDIVEIEARESSHPSPKWLDFVKTTMAEKHIKALSQRTGMRREGAKKEVSTLDKAKRTKQVKRRVKNKKRN